MDPNTLAIPFAFILLAAVICLLLIGTKWKWWQILLLILVVPTFSLIVWRSIESYKGWPSAADPPEKSLVHWALIREPDPAHDDPGAIYVWLTPLDEVAGSRNPLDYDSPPGDPRAYKLPYSRSLHKGMQRAKGMIGQGRPVVLDLSGKGKGGGNGSGEPGEGEPGDGDENGDGASGSDGGPGGRGRPGYRYPEGREDFKIYELPPAHPPRKLPEH